MILVVGARGMLGRELLDLYGDAARGVYRDELDLTDPVSVRRTIRALSPRVVINAVAYTDVDGCEGNEGHALRVNGEGVGYLAEESLAVGAKLVQISTDYVFDGGKGAPYLEDDPVNPISAYGRSKLAGEINARKNPDHLVIRTQWLYGRHGRNFVETMLRLAGEKDRLRVVDDQTGSPTWTRDLALATRALIDNDRKGTYHAVNGGSCTWFRFARTIFAEKGIDIPVTPMTSGELGRPAPRPLYSVLDCGKLLRDTGLALEGWDEALRNYLEQREKIHGEG